MNGELSKNPEVNNRVDEFLANAFGAGSVEEIVTAADSVGANTKPFGFEIADIDYPYQALDVVIGGLDTGRRLFVHENFTKEQQEDGEEKFSQANVGFLPVIARLANFMIRETPVSTQRLKNHAPTKPTSATIGKYFLAPVIKQLYASQSLVPDKHTIDNLVHVERLQTINGVDRLELGPRFIPPYGFEPVNADNFIQTAVNNTVEYGKLVQSSLEQALSN